MEKNKNDLKEEKNVEDFNPPTTTNINSENRGNDDNKKTITPKKEQLELKNNLFKISRKIRYFIYILELFCLFDLDQGGISASTKEIKYYFRMNDRELGSFGGISFLGTALGGIFSLSIINKINRKYLILIFLSTIISSLFFPTIISSKIILILSRIITGFSQSFMSIYLPVWVDQFGIYDKKSIMMSIISIPSAFCYLVGYVSAVLTSWRITFLISCFIKIMLLISFLFMKKIYFSKDILPKKSSMSKLMTSENINNNNSIKIDDNVSVFEDESQINKNYGKTSVFNDAKQCFKSKLFCFSTVSLITLQLISTGLQFWINDFLENSINILDKKERLKYFIIIILFTMIGAPLTGGFIMQKIGGYDSYKSIYFPFYCCIISLISSNLLFITSYKNFVAIIICTYLFSGCIMIFSLNGIIISSISKEYAGSASSISNLLYNICGRLVGPSIYGFSRSIFGIKYKLPMILLLDIKFITLVCLLFCFKYKKLSVNRYKF